MNRTNIIINIQIIVLILLLSILVIFLDMVEEQKLKPDWSQTWGGDNNDFGTIIIDYNESIYITGKSDHEIVILQFNQKGDCEWNNTYGDGSVSSMLVYNESIYITGIRNNDLFINRLNITGNYVWTRTWDGGFRQAYGYDLVCIDDYIYIAGRINDYDSVESALLLKYDTDGNLIWDKLWGKSNSLWSQALAYNNGELFVSGSINKGKPSSHEFDDFLLKYDTEGNLLWNKTWDVGTFVDNSKRDITIHNENIYITGTTGINERAEMFLRKFDLNGNVVWNKIWKKYEYSSGNAIVQVNDYLYITGCTKNYGENNLLFINKYDLKGNLIWSKSWLKNDKNCAYDMVEDNGFLYIVGSSYNPYLIGEDDHDIIIIKFNTSETNIFIQFWWAIVIIVTLFIALIINIANQKNKKGKLEIEEPISENKL